RGPMRRFKRYYPAMLRRPAMMTVLSAAACLLAAVGPCLGEPPAKASGTWERLSGRPAADSGKAPIPAPDTPAARNEPAVCTPGLPCGTRLLGTVRKNG